MPCCENPDVAITAQLHASEPLYHLVGGRRPQAHEQNFETLCAILQSQEVRHRHIDGNSGHLVYKVDYSRDLIDGEPMEQSTTSFCDIPFGDLAPIHTDKYGLFGVGVDRRIFAEWGGRPVIYVPRVSGVVYARNNRLPSLLRMACHALDHHFCFDRPEQLETIQVEGEFPESPKDAAENALDLLNKEVRAFFKVFDVDLPAHHPENFYMEREWRKFGALRLESTLREVLVAPGFEARLCERFPHLSVPVRLLAGPV